MPELAEVETLKRYLHQNIIGEKIVSYKQYRDNIRYPLSEKLAKDTIGGTIIDIQRRAKYIHIFLGNKNILTYHLGMTGRVTLEPADYERQKHDHVILFFESGKQLVFNDSRRFGMVYICHEVELNQQKFLSKMGIEPLHDEFNVDYLKIKLKGRSAAIKLSLMDNEVVVGVGNIYAAESLFLAKINPHKASCALIDQEIELLIQCIKQVLLRAIECGGTTFSNFLSGDRKPGYFVQELNVYGRHNQPCTICAAPIEKIKQGGRSTFYCIECQK